MSTPFVFDPNNVEAFVQKWMEEVGALHVNESYNGFGFFNPDRELLDVYLPDVENQWVDSDQPEGDRTTWDILADRCKQAGGTDIVHVHSHSTHGACDEASQMTAAAVIEMEARDLHFRGTAVIGHGKMQGFMFAAVIPEARAKQMIRDHHLVNEDRPLGYPEDLPLPHEILDHLREMAADPTSGLNPRLLEVMEQIFADLDEGRDPDMKLIAEGMQIAREGLAALEAKELEDGPTTGISLSDLMPYNPNTKGYLN
jgi:hypothetical protein